MVASSGSLLRPRTVHNRWLLLLLRRIMTAHAQRLFLPSSSLVTFEGSARAPTSWSCSDACRRLAATSAPWGNSSEVDGFSFSTLSSLSLLSFTRHMRHGTRPHLVHLCHSNITQPCSHTESNQSKRVFCRSLPRNLQPPGIARVFTLGSCESRDSLLFAGERGRNGFGLLVRQVDLA